jgi:hypothetical protein
VRVPLYYLHAGDNRKKFVIENKSLGGFSSPFFGRTSFDEGKDRS